MKKRMRDVVAIVLVVVIAVALVYLTMVIILSWLVSKLERRLRNSER